MSKKILMLVGDFVEDYEAMVPFGGRYAEIAVDQAVTDGNLVTAPAWPAHPVWLSQFTKPLESRVPVHS